MRPLTLNADARLLIARPDRVGDVIISTSCLAPLRQAFPRGELFFLAAERMRPLLDNHPDLSGFISDAAQIARLAPDAIVHLHPDKEVYLAAQRAAVPIRIGYRHKSLGRYLTHSLADRRAEGLKHEAANNFDLLQLIGVDPPSRLEPNVHLPESALGLLRAKLPWPLESTPFAVLNPSAHSPVARWPVESFLRLADRLESEGGLRSVFIGADAEDCLPGGASPVPGSRGQNGPGRIGLAPETRARAGHAGHGTEPSRGGGWLPRGGDLWPHHADVRTDPLAPPDGTSGHRGEVRPTKALGITGEVLAAEFCGDSR